MVYEMTVTDNMFWNFICYEFFPPNRYEILRNPIKVDERVRAALQNSTWSDNGEGPPHERQNLLENPLVVETVQDILKGKSLGKKRMDEAPEAQENETKIDTTYETSALGMGGSQISYLNKE